MNTGVVSKRFAKALLDYAVAQGKEDIVYSEVKELTKHYLNLPGLKKAIENPMLEKNKKLDLLKEAAGGKGVSTELMRFFDLVLVNRREQFLQFMAWSYISLYREAKKIMTGKVTTAVPSAKLVSHLEQLASQKTHNSVELEAIVKPEIIGGFIIELGDYRMDASVANQLARVKHEFIDKNRRIV